MDMPTTRATRITSTANPAVRAAVELRARRGRDGAGRTLVDGGRELRRALEAGQAVPEAFVCPELLTGEDARAALAMLEDRAAVVRLVAQNVYEKIAYGERADGIVGVLAIPSLDLAGLRSRVGDRALVAVVEAVEKPGNLGAVLRSADGAGLDALIAADARTDLFNPNAIRASLGTIFTVPLAAATTSETVTWLRTGGFAIVAARVDAEQLYTQVDLRGRTAIVLGSETTGLSDAWCGDDIVGVRLPMLGVADSLNVSTAAAIFFYEARRQRDTAHR